MTDATWAPIVVVIAFNWLAYWRRDIFLYIVSIPPSVMFAFDWYEDHPEDFGLTIAVAVMVLAGYSLWKVIENLWERIR